MRALSATLQKNGTLRLASLISAERIVPEMVSREHQSAIDELVDHLDTLGFLRNCGRDELLEALHTREEFISTGIGSGVAIPHTFSDRIDEVIAVMGRSREGIDFSAHDDAPVHLVILFVVPRQQYDQHLRTLAAIAHLFHDDEMKRQLLESDTAGEMLLTLQRRTPRAVAA
jgi:nitrogen PTS system EIIA component